jgi:Lon protease-like protein
MAALIPLFPLGTVLVPGAPLPLRIFEDRYRKLVADLLEQPPELRQFGVVAIKSGREVGEDGVRTLHDVGCLAQIATTERGADGTYQLETIGTRRFRLLEVEEGAPYLRGHVDWLPEPSGAAEPLVPIVHERFASYRGELARLQGTSFELPDLPSDPAMLSYVVAATVIADVADRQGFLAEYDAEARLAREASWLARETGLLGKLSALPGPDLLKVAFSAN